METKMKEQLLKESKSGKRQKQTRKYILLGLIGLVIVVLLVAYSATPTTMKGCVFCEIVAGNAPSTKIEVETDEYIIFKDIKPASTYHYLCVSKRHIDSLKDMTKEDIPLLDQMEAGLKSFFKSRNIDIDGGLFGFHMPPFITVKHLHMHGISPRSDMSWLMRIVFKPFTAWFKTVEEARSYLENKS